MQRDISVRLTDQNDQTSEIGPPLKLVPNIPVGANWNGLFHLMYQPKLLEFWVEWKVPVLDFAWHCVRCLESCLSWSHPYHCLSCVYTSLHLRSSFRGKSKCIMRECASERYCRKEWKTLIERLCTVDCGWVFSKVWFRGLNRQSRRNCNVVVAGRLSRWCQNLSEFVVLVEGK